MSGPEEETFPEKSWCFTCAMLAGEKTLPGGEPLWRSERVVANHHEDNLSDQIYPDSRSGWIVVAPVRHVVRVYDLTEQEWDEIGEVVRTVDEGLTELYGSRRTLVASLGWETRDHIHFHCVPTFGEEVSLGSLNFDGAYVPLGITSDEAAISMRMFLSGRLRDLG